MKYLCVDACYLIALYDPGDEHHEAAERSFIELFERSINQIVIVWPILYETLSTRMAKPKQRVSVESIRRDFTRFEAANQMQWLDDSPYRDGAVTEFLDETMRHSRSYRSLSLTDRVIRRLLADSSVRTDALLTFDVEHFVDICSKRRIEILPQNR